VAGGGVPGDPLPAGCVVRRAAYGLLVAALVLLALLIGWLGAPAWLAYVWAACTAGSVTTAVYLDRSE
jgi:hypothetical protein